MKYYTSQIYKESDVFIFKRMETSKRVRAENSARTLLLVFKNCEWPRVQERFFDAQKGSRKSRKVTQKRKGKDLLTLEKFFSGIFGKTENGKQLTYYPNICVGVLIFLRII